MTTDYPDNRGPGRPSKYNLKTIPPGASVFIPGATTCNVGKSARSIKYMRFKCRSVMKNGTAGTKVTRIK